MPYVPLRRRPRPLRRARRAPRRSGRRRCFIHGAGAGAGALVDGPRARRAPHATRSRSICPGHGPSAASARRPRSPLERYRDAVGELAATLCLGPSVLVGHSLGALVAIEAALAWPDKVRALVLCAAAPRMTVDPEVFRLLRDDPDALRPLAGRPRALAARQAGHPARLFSPPPRPRRPRSRAADFEIVRATDLRTRPRERRLPDHLARRRRRPDRAARAARGAARARSSPSPAPATSCRSRRPRPSPKWPPPSGRRNWGGFVHLCTAE